MSNDLLEVIERGSIAPVRASPPEIPGELDRAVLRFHAPVRREIRRLVRNSPRLADLATVFPGILFALATRRGTAASRLQAMSLIDNGAQLKAVARALDMPMWLRRLPAEAFGDLPAVLPKSESFGRRIAKQGVTLDPRLFDDAVLQHAVWDDHIRSQ